MSEAVADLDDPRENVQEFNLLEWQSRAKKEKDSGVENLVINAGVNTGKTQLGSAFALEDFKDYAGREPYWWIAPEGHMLDTFWKDFQPAAQAWGWHTIGGQKLLARNQNRSILEAVSIKNFNRLSSKHPRRTYFDEAAKVSKVQWNLVRIRQANSEFNLFMSTPQNNHWQDVVEWGKKRRDGKWAQVTVTTPEAGLLSKDKLDEMAGELPDWLWRQEFMAEIVSGEGSVFKDVKECAVGRPEDPKEGRVYLITYDPAKHRDYAVGSVWLNRRQVWVERWHHMDYEAQAPRLVDLAIRYNHASIIYDQTGPGEAFGEILETTAADRISIQGVVFDNAIKSAFVNAAVVGFEKGDLILIDAKHGEPYDAFVDEVVRFESKRSRSGLRYVYEAPSGRHDDCVTTVLLRMAGASTPSIKSLGKPGEGEEKHDRISSDFGTRRRARIR
jgi:hypothetical protein